MASREARKTFHRYKMPCYLKLESSGFNGFVMGAAFGGFFAYNDDSLRDKKVEWKG